MRRVGLTGGIACGKTTVCQFFERLGAVIISADDLAHDIVQPGAEAYLKIVESFGSAILNEDRSINRQVLGSLIFNTDALREKLNAITHPIIIRRTDERMEELARQKRWSVAIVDAALMVEAGSYRRFEKLIVVWCSEELQIERLRCRSHLTREEALLRIRAQWPLAEKRKLADYEVETSGSLEATQRQVEAIYRKLSME